MSDLPLPLQGRRALVIGASSGIGLASAMRLAGDGADVLLAGRTPDRLEAAAREVTASARGGASVDHAVCDGMDADQVRETIARAGGDAGLDIAVTIPGGGGYAPVLAIGDDEFGEQIDINVRPVFLTIKYAGLAMAGSGGGSIVAISSTAAQFSSPFLSAYCAAKAAVDQLVKVAADELGRVKVRVNSVRPGLTRTGATGPLFEDSGALGMFLEQQPLARGGEADDIANAVRYLAGPESDWVTGQWLTVDGGNTLRRFPDVEPITRSIMGDEAFDSVYRGERIR